MRVLQLIDSLHAGGAERVAVQFANALHQKIDASFLCVTREEGLLKSTIGLEVGYLFLGKRHTLDLKAFLKLLRFVKHQKIDVIHAHSSSYFLATCVKVYNPKLRLVWHDHYGNSDYLDTRKAVALKLCSRWFDFVFAVNPILGNWAIANLKCKDVSYLRNYATLQEIEQTTFLNGNKGKRILCLANLRPQKSHQLLFKAFSNVVAKHSDWSLHCVGKDFKDVHSETLKNELDVLNLNSKVFMYGSKSDISSILNQSEIGVLASQSEGLPLSLLEYGLGHLAVVTTDVGSCKEVVDHGVNGYLVESGDANGLAMALLRYIEDDALRFSHAQKLHQKVKTSFSESAVIDILVATYNNL